MVFSPAISALQRSLGAGKALTAAQVKVREVDGVEADMELDTCNVKYDIEYEYYQDQRCQWAFRLLRSKKGDKSHLNGLRKEVSMSAHPSTC